jgi:signal transduction histidine kinase
MTHAEMDALIGQMVHDLRTPLSAIAGYAEMLEEESDPATQQRFVKNIRRAAGEMEDLLKRVRAEARERTGSVQSPDGDV